MAHLNKNKYLESLNSRVCYSTLKPLIIGTKLVLLTLSVKKRLF